jgi:hypothetical protein
LYLKKEEMMKHTLAARNSFTRIFSVMVILTMLLSAMGVSTAQARPSTKVLAFAGAASSYDTFGPTDPLGTSIQSKDTTARDVSFNDKLAGPNLPTVVQPIDGATGVVLQPADPASHVDLQATVSDPDTPTGLTVSFYGRPFCTIAPNFTVVALPDTQYETSQTNSGLIAMFDDQTQWIVDNKTARNIVYVTHLGDIVDINADTDQWNRANEALTRLETGSVAFGLSLGNHDGAPSNTGNFNNIFPYTRFPGAGHYPTDNNNDNNYGLFSSGGMDFIVIHIEYGASAGVRTWANNLLAYDYPARRAIVVTHNLLTGSATPASFSTEGQALYDALKANANLFLMLGGHADGSVSRTDTYNGHTVYSLRSDFQFVTGGNGWLRVMEFQPLSNQIQVYTYSPYVDQWNTDANNQFTRHYAMGGTGCAPWDLIGTTTGVASGSSPMVSWGDRLSNTQYQWYVTVSDGVNVVTGPIWSLTTGDPTAVILNSFSAMVEKKSVLSDGKSVIVSWETTSEVFNLGFNLYRATSIVGERIKVNSELIPTLVYPGSPSGATYIYTDTSLNINTTYYYWLENVDISGKTGLTGPELVKLVAGKIK